MKHRFIGILLILTSCAKCAFAQSITIDNSNTIAWEIPTNVIDSITTTETDSLCIYFHDGNTFLFSHNNVRKISTAESDIEEPDDDDDNWANDAICERDGFTNLTNIKASDYNTTKTRFKTVRLDLSNGQGNTDGNYVSVILHNLSTGSTYWSTNRIQTISKSVGRQICDNNSREMDITEVGHLVPGSDDLYEYTFSSFMEIFEIDKYVIKSMVWLKLE